MESEEPRGLDRLVSIDCCRECSSHHLAHIENEKRGGVDRIDQLSDGHSEVGRKRGTWETGQPLARRHKNVILMVVNGGKMRTKGE